MQLIHYNFRDSEDALIYVHIGKCGGASLAKSIAESEVLKSKFNTICKVHIEKPPILKRANYLVVVRNPIERAISAFNWRYKLVVEDEAQRDRFLGEWDILKRYESISKLADALYDNDNLNEGVARDFRRIHHLKEDMVFYLHDLLKNIKPKQIFAVLSTETLDFDVQKLLGVPSVPRVHSHAHMVSNEKKSLSLQARANLRKFLQPDYDCLETILQMNPSTHCDKVSLLY